MNTLVENTARRLLTVQGLVRSFGSLKVTDNMSFDVYEGETLGILGPNGAGKSSLFNLITGDLAPHAGTISFDGTALTPMSAWKRCQMGIGRTYQIPKPFGGMTVLENLLVSASYGARLPLGEAVHHAKETLAFTGLAAKEKKLAGSLSLLDRKRLELARALAAKPKLLLLDEIAGGLTDAEAAELVELIRTIYKQKVTIVWIEHVMHALRAVATRLMVIDFGKLIMHGVPEDVFNHPEVRRIYMGIES